MNLISTAQEQNVLQDSTAAVVRSVKMKLPNGISGKYLYNAQENYYEFTQPIAGYELGYPLIISPEEYWELVRKESTREYFSEKQKLYDNSKTKDESLLKNILPNFRLNSDVLETIFGGDQISLIPQGSIGVDMGVLWQKNDNPSLSPRNRSNLSFDFDQQIRLGMVGKIGERLSINANYDTQATFDFQNLIKISYNPPTVKEATGIDVSGINTQNPLSNVGNMVKSNEDNILQNIEVGNISMPLTSSLIQGAQSLFGLKTEMKFGRTRITTVLSEQRSQNNSVVAKGGGTINEFNLTALDYEEDRHFFLSHFFRDQYDEALENYPYVNSQVQITRIEVWMTNRVQRTNNVRNIVALQDLGESNPNNSIIGRHPNTPIDFFNNPVAPYLPSNNANAYDPEQIGIGGALLDQVRDIATVPQAFDTPGYKINPGFDYAIIENAHKLEEGRDFFLDPQLGYISLSQRLSADEILAVAFQYTYNGKVYQVGEFANGGVESTSVTNVNEQTALQNNALVLKLLKSNITSVQDPIWDLMMKNIYPTGAYQLSEEDFKFNIIYANPSPRNYITSIDSDFGSGWPSSPKPLEERTLLNVFNFDRLNGYNDVQVEGDGFFDFIPNRTINLRTGSIIFTKVEPFGAYLFELLGGGDYDVENDEGYTANQKQYVYRELYAQTKASAFEKAEKNKFLLKGHYKSASSNGIPIGAFNVPRGSVRVTVGKRILVEGVDYTVNYQMGTVQLLDPSLEASNAPINISVEDNAVFGQQNKRFTGMNITHEFSDNFILGATYLNLNERPLTQKASYGIEPVNNSIYGFNLIYSSEVPFLTRLANKLPNVETQAPSTISLRAEMAALKPGTPKFADFEGESTTYIDDFEGAQTLIDIRGALGWSLASTPLAYGNGSSLYGSSPNDEENLKNGYGRGKLAWYSIDPIFYSFQRPDGVTNNDLSTNSTRRIYIDEVFPQVDIAQGQTTVQTTLDLSYYPEEKGPYNNNESYTDLQEDDRWAGIMRPMSTTNFENANVEFIQFWLLDPYVDGIASDPGTLVFNLGNISEDILKDGKKQYENGLPDESGTAISTETSWGKVPASQSLLYAFDAIESNRALQDVGFDGLNDSEEAAIYTSNSGPDPALDNYVYYLNRSGSLLERYKDFNNPDGNAPVAVSNTNRGSTTLPDVEDVDRDLTMNTVNSYFEYKIDIKPGTTINDPFVTDIKEQLSPKLPNGSQVNTRWIQYKIPLSAFSDALGGITDFRSISFMRMYLTGFSKPVVLRFATLDLVRGDWRTYSRSLTPETDAYPLDDTTQIDVSTVNIEENNTRTPIPYVLPPGVVREQLNNNNTIIRQNEQSLSLVVKQLEPKDSRAVFKNTQYDIRQYKRLKMFMHAEKIANSDYIATEKPLVGFLRIGTDYSENFYQVELPLTFTEFGATTANEIWPSENQIEISTEVLAQLKSKGIQNQSLSKLTYYDLIGGELVEVEEFDPRPEGSTRVGIRGNPSLANIRGIMVGVKNSSDTYARGEVWFNELRLSGMNREGGWAAIAGMDLSMADVMSVSFNGSKSTAGFGGIDQMPNERSREDLQSYDMVTNLNIGAMLPANWGLNLPLNYSVAEELVTPKFDPVYEDLTLSDRIAAAGNNQEADLILSQAESYTKRNSINIIGLRKDKNPEKQEAKNHFFDIENITLNYSYNQTQHRDFEVEHLNDENIKAGIVYGYQFKPLAIEPFAKKDSILKSDYWKWLKEVNFNLLPSSVAFNANFDRSFNEQQFRDVQTPGVDALDMPLLQQRNYLFNWQYAIQQELTKSIRLNLNANSKNVVRNYFNLKDDKDSGINQELTVWDDFFNYGKADRFNQQFQLNYKLPFDKFPFLNFIDAQYTYTSNFEWKRGDESVREVAGGELNNVQNSNTHNLNASMTFNRFYKFLGIEQTASVANFMPGRSNAVAKNQKAKTPIWKSLLTSLKRLNVSYSENNGKFLPGFTRQIGSFGTQEPSLGFVFGSQSDVRFQLAKQGYLTTFENFNEAYISNTNKQLKIDANAQPIKDLTIDLSADMQHSYNYKENFRVEEVGNGSYQYVNMLGNEVGNYNRSLIMISTFFKKSDELSSDNFDSFKGNRLIIANRLAAGLSQEEAALIDQEGFPERYGKSAQDVLLPAFIAAYSGKDASVVELDPFKGIPLPNWNMKYTGFMNIKWFEDRFNRFSISHGYRAALSINSYRTNLEKTNTTIDPRTGDYRPDQLYGNLVLTDQFNPLVRIDFETKNSMRVLLEVKMDRALSMSFDNNLLTEMKGKELTAGFGYRIKDVRFNTNFGGSRSQLKGDLNIKADVSLRDNLTVIRNLELDNTQINAGQYLLSTKISADYAVNKNLNAVFFYDFNSSRYAVSTAFPQQTINTGFRLKYNFGN